MTQDESWPGRRTAPDWPMMRPLGLVFGLSFLIGDSLICGLIVNMRFDPWGHVGLAAAMLAIGAQGWRLAKSPLAGNLV